MRVNERIGAFIDGLGTFLIGVTMVFLALVLLILLIHLVGKVVASLEGKHVAKVVAETQSVVVPEVKTESIPEATVQNEVDELELVAVITAAIAASLGTTSDKLQVRSLRKVDRRTRTF